MLALRSSFPTALWLVPAGPDLIPSKFSPASFASSPPDDPSRNGHGREVAVRLFKESRTSRCHRSDVRTGADHAVAHRAGAARRVGGAFRSDLVVAGSCWFDRSHTRLACGDVLAARPVRAAT
jgi:hypothetical protein